MSIILLIRHGENDYIKTQRLAGRLPDIHLNMKGQEQAQALADKLKDTPVNAIYSSPLARAVETAQPVADKLNLPVTARDGLIETDYGDWQNESLKELKKKALWSKVQNSPGEVQFPGGETFTAAQERIRLEIETLCKNHQPHDTILCVTHADPIKLVTAYFIGLPLDYFQRLIVKPASITSLQLEDSGSRLLTLNYDISLILSDT